MIIAMLLSGCDTIIDGNTGNTVESQNSQNNPNDPTFQNNPPTNFPIVVGPQLSPGTGFTGATQEPGQIGSGTAKVIARWDVVPYQTINSDTFKVGVVAFHIAGIDRVEFSVDGGPFTAVNAMALNTQTNVVEYFATLSRSDFNQDKPIEIRAIAYPKASKPQAEGTGGYAGGGYPRLLEPLYLYVDSGTLQTPVTKYASTQGSDYNGCGAASSPCRTPFKAAQEIAAQNNGSADGGIIYLDAGDYDLSQNGGSVPNTQHRWLTITAKPGVTRDQVRMVTTWFPGSTINRLRFFEVTFKGQMGGDDFDDVIWLDHVSCIGAGISTSVGWSGFTGGFKANYWTNVNVSDDEVSLPGGVTLARDVHAQRVQKAMVAPKLVINSTWDTTAPYNGGHTTFISWNFLQSSPVDNAIVYGVRGTNLNSGGIFIKTTDQLSNIALVNVAMQLTSVQGSSIGIDCNSLSHFLIWNFTHLHSLLWGMAESKMHDLSIRGNHFNVMGIDAIPNAGDSVNNLWFDQNSYGLDYGAITPGTNFTTADPQFINTFTPSPTSPLRNRLYDILVTTDIHNHARAIPATIGAVE